MQYLFDVYKTMRAKADATFIILNSKESARLNNIIDSYMEAQRSVSRPQFPKQIQTTQILVVRPPLSAVNKKREHLQAALKKQQQAQVPLQPQVIVSETNNQQPKKKKKPKFQKAQAKPKKTTPKKKFHQPYTPEKKDSVSPSSLSTTSDSESQDSSQSVGEALQLTVPVKPIEPVLNEKAEIQIIHPAVLFPVPIIVEKEKPSYLAALNVKRSFEPEKSLPAQALPEKDLSEPTRKPAQLNHNGQRNKEAFAPKRKIEVDKSRQIIAEEKPQNHTTPTPKSIIMAPIQPKKEGFSYLAALQNLQYPEPEKILPSKPETVEASKELSAKATTTSVKILEVVLNPSRKNKNGKKKKGIYVPKNDPAVEKKKGQSIAEKANVQQSSPSVGQVHPTPSPTSQQPSVVGYPSGTFIVQGHPTITKIVLRKGGQQVYSGDTEMKQGLRLEMQGCTEVQNSTSLDENPERVYFAKVNGTNGLTVNGHSVLKGIVIEQEH